MEVDEARQGDEPCGVDRPVGPSALLPGRRTRRPQPRGRQSCRRERRADDSCDAHDSSPASRWYSTDMRTDTPFATWSSTVDAGESRAARDLEPAVHRARMHHHRSLGQPDESLVGEAPLAGVLAFSREERVVHPLPLDAQHHENVGRRCDGRIEAETGADRPAGDADREERRGRDEVHIRAEQGEQPDVRTRDPAVEDVADDRHPDPVEAPPPRRGTMQPATDRERVEEGLRRVLVRAVARVDDPGVDPPRVRERVRRIRRPGGGSPRRPRPSRTASGRCP